MKLYFSPGACSLSPHIVLREAALPFQLELVDLHTKKTSTGADFFQINSKGLVPALLLDDGDILTEGPAIVQYIADLVPAMKLAPPIGSRERYHLQEWLNFITSELHKTLSPLFRPSTPQLCKSIALALNVDRFSYVDRHLASRPHLMGEAFMVPDAYLFAMTNSAQKVGIDLTRWPNLAAFHERVRSRPAVQQAMRAEGLEDKDRLEASTHPDPLQELRAALLSAGPGLESIKIGIVDGLPDLTHPALKGAPIEVLKIMIPENSVTPDQHGTSICSVIFGNNHEVRGIAPNCTGLVLPVFFENRGEGQPKPASQLDLARAITFALENDVSIINVSAGQRVAAAEADTHLDQALQRCEGRRVLVVAAAGNDGCACLHLPAGITSVLAVGAADIHGKPLELSNWNEAYRQSGLLAPGEGLTVAVSGGGVRTATGTSYATAIVSGVAALLLSVARNKGYQIDAVDIRGILLESAAPCKLEDEAGCERFLAGKLDASAALARLHQVGALRELPKRSSATIGVTDAASGQLRRSNSREHTMMTESTLVPSDAATADSLGLTSADSVCQTKPEPESKNAAFKQQGTPANLTSSISVIQSSPLRAVSQQAFAEGQPRQMVYAIGGLWFDFGTEARHDLFIQQLDPVRANNPLELISFLREHPEFAPGLIFILMQEQVPLYAIQPAGPFAVPTYNAMLDAIQSSLDTGGNEQRVSIPGFISGTTRLLNGMNVPTVFPDLRGMYKWRSSDLIESTRALVQRGGDSDEELLNFLNRVYYELRNLGVTPQDRALNFAATNAYQARVAFAHAAAKSLVLDSMKVVKSPFCRPDSDCWDVEMSMFDDEDERRPNQVYRFTVDVSEIIPVTVGTVRMWARRAGRS
jgi:cyanobactin maturation PatA/PatG family protease